jgi:hypothetical protein
LKWMQKNCPPKCGSCFDMVWHGLTCFDRGLECERSASWNFDHIHMPLAHRLGIQQLFMPWQCDWDRQGRIECWYLEPNVAIFLLKL